MVTHPDGTKCRFDVILVWPVDPPVFDQLIHQCVIRRHFSCQFLLVEVSGVWYHDESRTVHWDFSLSNQGMQTSCKVVIITWSAARARASALLPASLDQRKHAVFKKKTQRRKVKTNKKRPTEI